MTHGRMTAHLVLLEVRCQSAKWRMAIDIARVADGVTTRPVDISDEVPAGYPYPSTALSVHPRWQVVNSSTNSLTCTSRDWGKRILNAQVKLKLPPLYSRRHS